MKKLPTILLILLAVNIVITAWWNAKDRFTHVVGAKTDSKSQPAGYAGSPSCRECHERFYDLWSASHHGLAMQPYTPEFAQKNLRPQKEELTFEDSSYTAQVGPEQGWVKEVVPGDEKKYRIAHVMGGKNVYYFLTPMEKGRLQVLPIAYDIQKSAWFDTAASGIRHFSESDTSPPIAWTDPLYTFNTSCYGCHVSQLTTNYDLETDSYNTVWAEPGINCETCHGPSRGHNEVCQNSPGKPPKDLKIIITKSFTPQQTNAMCASCHAKQSSISSSFMPGDHYFDHFDLATLEHSDYYPDGRDLGENYTYTSWLMSPCVKAGELDCIHCHTSSGRYRFKETSTANSACLPCHTEFVKNAADHSRHPSDSEGNKCVSCHMPKTMFARMNRSDHSMRSPTPAATIKFKSPNACNTCHSDKDPAWSDKFVRKWYRKDYQKSILKTAGLIDAARKNDFSRLPEMLEYLKSKDDDEVTAASFVRLLRRCDSNEKWSVINKLALEHSSPLVRAAAAGSLDQRLTKESIAALLAAVGDEYRLVRIRAAAGLAGIPLESLSKVERENLTKAATEFKGSLLSRPDDYTAHYNLGNYQIDCGQFREAVDSYKISHKLRPDSILPLNNIAFAYNALGENEEAAKAFRKILALEPDNFAANMNLGMLLGEMGRMDEAEKAFRSACKSDAKSAVAAYNLGIICSSRDPGEAVAWCKKAYELKPDEEKYGFTYAYYLLQSGDTHGAIDVLNGLVNREVPHSDSYSLLGRIYIQQGQYDLAKEIFQKAQNNEKLSD